MRQAVLNPVRNTCFVTECNAGDERVRGGRAVVLVWLVCMAGGPSRTLATYQGRGPPNRPLPAPPRGETSRLVVL
eukprot:1602530-Prymnesium_polylepis.1